MAINLSEESEPSRRGASLNRSGPANPISNQPRPDRVARSGPANQVGNTKWSDIVKLGRGPANQLT